MRPSKPQSKSQQDELYNHLYAIWSADDMDKGEFEFRSRAIQSYIDRAVLSGRIKELKELEPPEQYEQYARLMGRDDCQICGFDAVKFRKHIQDRIEELTAHLERGES